MTGRFSLPSRIVRWAPIFVLFVYIGMMFPASSTTLFQIDDPQTFAFVAETESFWELFGTDVFHFFRPVKNIFFAFYSLLAPFGVVWCHLIGILACAISFFPVRALCRRVLHSEEKALLAASVWLFSPTLVSSVTWLSSINIVVMFLFASCSLVLHDAAWDNGRYRASRTLLAGLCLFVSLLSYESAVSVVPLLFLFDLYLRPVRLRTDEAKKAHVFYLTVAILYLVLRFSVSARTAYTGMGFVNATRPQTILSSPWFVLEHALLWFWPFGRLFVLGSYRWGDVPVWKLLCCWGVLVTVSAWCLSRIRKNPVQKYCLLIFLVGFAPTSNCLGFGNGPFGDYYMGFASVGLAAWVADRVISAIDRKAGVCCIACALLLAVSRIFGLAETASWAAAWENGTEVVAASVRNHPEFFSNKIVLAMLIFGKDRYDEALRLCAEVEDRIEPVSRHMANVMALRGNYETIVNQDAEAALRLFDGMTEFDPSEEMKKKRHFLRGKVFELLFKDVAVAENEYGRAVAGRNPNLQAAHRLALLKDREGHPEDAFAIWKRILRIKPDDDSALWHLAMACRKAGDETAAAKYEARALKQGGR